MYRPQSPFNVAARILHTEYEKINGVNTKKAFYHVVVSVLDGTRTITVYKDDEVCTETLWVKTKYTTRSGGWVEGVSRAITGSWSSSYSTEGITYDVGIYHKDEETEPMCRVIASDGQVKDSADEFLIYISAKSYGGTERTVNDRYVIEDTLEVETWYRPDITSIDRIKLLDDGSYWEILNTPEDIERRHQFLKFKMKRLKGDA